MTKKILVLVGSPRKNGNTEILADAFIKGAQASGNAVTKIHLRDHKISGCIDCKYCFQHPGQCSQKDDMQNIYPHLYDADMIVFASPVYYFGLTAQLKAVIDRFFASAKKAFPIQSSALLLPFEDTNPETAGPSISNYKIMADLLGWQDKGIITAPGVFEKGDIEGHQSLAQAEALGKSIN